MQNIQSRGGVDMASLFASTSLKMLWEQQSALAFSHCDSDTLLNNTRLR